MPILTRADFAIVCKTTPAVINTNISRKKISTLATDKKLIDTENPLNKIFKKNQLALANGKVKDERAEKKQQKYQEAAGFRKVIEDALPDADPEIIDEIFSKEETKTNKKINAAKNEEDKERVDWDLRKKKADAIKAEKAAEMQGIQIEKLNGKLMPVDLVKTILKVNIQHINKTYEQDLINIASIYCDILAGGSRDKLAEIILELRTKLNDVIKRTEQTAYQEIENVIDDYAETRSRGERS